MTSGSSEARARFRDLTDVEFAVLRKYACVRCTHFGYCRHCDVFECRLGLPLSEVPCESFVVNIHVRG